MTINCALFFFSISLIKYEWDIKYIDGTNVFNANQKENTDIIATGFRKQNLAVNAGQLTENREYQVSLQAWYGSSRDKATRINLSRKTAVLPHSGKCAM